MADGAPTTVSPGVPRRELLLAWAAAIGILGGARAIAAVEPTGLLGANLAGVAALLFVLIPDRALRRRGEDWGSCGLPWWGPWDGRTWRAWGRGLLVAAGACAVLFPPFAFLFTAWARLAPQLPPGLAPLLPAHGLPPELHLRLPAQLPLLAVNQLLVVALPEELFYRGWMQTAWAARDPARRRRVLGAEIGPGFLATQALFAAGHLVSLQPWRIGTFFPGLVLGWLRARTGNLAAPVLAHALMNLLLATLEASLFGPAPR